MNHLRQNSFLSIICAPSLITAENLRIPAEELDYDIPLFGDGIGLDSVDSLEIIACIDSEYGVAMTGVAKENFYNITSLTKYVVANM